MFTREELQASNLADSVKGLSENNTSVFALPESLHSLALNGTTKVQYLGGEFRKKKTAPANYPVSIEAITDPQMSVVVAAPDMFYFAKIFSANGEEFRNFPKNADNLATGEITFKKTREGDENAIRGSKERYSEFTAV